MSLWQFRSATIVFMVGAFLTEGCGKGAGNRSAVSGTVTFQNQPLDQGRIQFFPKDKAGPPSAGAPIEDGGYDIPAEHGLAPGLYRVEISSTVRDEKAKQPAPGEMIPAPTRERIPEKYNKTSTETVEVKAGQANQFNFTID